MTLLLSLFSSKLFLGLLALGAGCLGSWFHGRATGAAAATAKASTQIALANSQAAAAQGQAKAAQAVTADVQNSVAAQKATTAIPDASIDADLSAMGELRKD